MRIFAPQRILIIHTPQVIMSNKKNTLNKICTSLIINYFIILTRALLMQRKQHHEREIIAFVTWKKVKNEE